LLPAFLQVYGVVPAAFRASTLVTSMFLHGSWMHVIGNMWYLWIFGDNVEDRLGHGRFIVFYLLCGIVAAFGQILIDPTSTLPTIGASGAIAGVMGAYFVLYPQSRVLTLIPLIIFWDVVELPAIILLGFWFLMQLFSAGAIAVTASTGGGGVAFMAHVAGFITGILAVFVFRQRQRTEQYWA
jgi:membrane associated rhomboid family serine protease